MRFWYSRAMSRFRYGKLVRDKIVDNQIASGAKPSFRQLSTEEHKRELVNKIVEEAQEIIQAQPHEVASEIADVQQALDDLKEKYGVTEAAVKQAQKRKNDESGAFKKGHFVEYVEVDEGDAWVRHYRAHADRYPEV